MAQASPKANDRKPDRKAYIGKVLVDALSPEASEYVVWDGGDKDVVKGFGVKVTPAGAKVYIYRYRFAAPGQPARMVAPRKVTLGRHGAVTPDQARKHAKAIAADVAKGIDPLQAKVDAAAVVAQTKLEVLERVRLEGDLAFSRLAPVFLKWYEDDKKRRPSSVAMARLVIDRYLTPALGDKPLPHIRRDDLQPIFDAMPSERRGMKRAVFAYASTLFAWAMKERGLINENPLRAMSKPDAPDARERVLSDAELADVWRATEALGDPFAPFYRLLVMTAQRRSEVAGLKWDELDRAAATWTIPTARAKNKKPHIVPMAPAVIAELDRLALAGQVKAKAKELDGTIWPKAGFVLTTTGRSAISGMTKAKAALDTTIAKARGGEDTPAPITAWRVHDLRRTAATGFQRLGVRFEVTEAVLNHVSGARAGVAGIYQQHDWKEEKRTALEAWTRHVAAIIAPTDANNVVPIGAAKQSA